MRSSVAQTNGSGQAQAGDRTEIERSQERDLWFADLKAAMQQTGWTEDALAAHWGVDRSYVNRLMNDEKPWSNDRVLALPDELEGALYANRAERFGAVVVLPLSGSAAVKALVAGLMGVMAQAQLPLRANAMAKADLLAVKKAIAG